MDILEDILGGRNLEETVWNQLCAHLAQLDLLEPEELISLVEFLSKRKLMKLRATHAPGERTAPADPTDVVSASSGGPRESSAHPELIEAVRRGILPASELARHSVRLVQDQDRRAPKGLGWDISGLHHSLGSSPTVRPTQREVCK